MQFDFGDKSDEYLLGFEAGIVWSHLLLADHFLRPTLPLRAANRTIFRRMAEATGYEVTFVRVDANYDYVSFDRAPRRPAKHLKLVE